MLYLGAGLSIPAPSHGPKGDDVALRLRPYVAELLGVSETELEGASLEALASRVQAERAERLPQLKERAADAWSFRDMPPNYAHEIIVLLMREGLVQVVSANWDCGVENAGYRLEVGIEGVSTSQARLALPVHVRPLFKVHGCARRPETLVLTREEVDRPLRWARAEVETALSGGVVAFVGLGTVGAYVGEPVEELADIWLRGEVSIRVVDPSGPSDPWVRVLGDRVDEVSVEMSGGLFVDELARATVIEALSRAEARARELHDSENGAWTEATLGGLRALRDSLQQSTAPAVLRWWRDGVSSDEHGRQFVFEPAGQTSMLCVAQLLGLDGGDVIAVGDDGRLAIRSERTYYEIEHKPGALRRTVEGRARDRIARRRRDGQYEPGVPVTVVIHGADGVFPARDASQTSPLRRVPAPTSHLRMRPTSTLSVLNTRPMGHSRRDPSCRQS